jgi:hypothetical protein
VRNINQPMPLSVVIPSVDQDALHCEALLSAALPDGHGRHTLVRVLPMVSTMTIAKSVFARHDLYLFQKCDRT